MKTNMTHIGTGHSVTLMVANALVAMAAAAGKKLDIGQFVETTLKCGGKEIRNHK
jgi:hypothetical protein